MKSSIEFAEKLRRIGLNDAQAGRLLHRHADTIGRWRTGAQEPDGLAMAHLDVIEYLQNGIKALRKKVAKGKG